MWKTYGCAKAYPDLAKLDEKSIDLIERIVTNKKLYNILRITLFITSTILTGLDFTIDAGFLVHSLITSNEYTKSEHKVIFDVLKSMVHISKITALNFINIDNRVRAINPKSNFVKEILSLKFTGDFFTFEKDCDRIFGKETYNYTAKDFVSLLCVFIDSMITEKDEKAFINNNMGLIKILSPYRTLKKGKLNYEDFLDEQSYTITATKNYIELMKTDKKSTEHWKLYHNKNIVIDYYDIDENDLVSGKYIIKIPLSTPFVDRDKVPKELYNELLIAQKQYNSRELRDIIKSSYKQTDINDAKNKVNEAWKKYEDSIDANKVEKKNLRFENDQASSIVIGTFVKHLISSKAELRNEDLAIMSDHASKLNIIDNVYSPLLGTITRPEIISMTSTEDEGKIDAIIEFKRLLDRASSLNDDINIKYSKEKDIEIQREIEMLNLRLKSGEESNKIAINKAIGDWVKRRKDISNKRVIAIRELRKIDKEIKAMTNKHKGLYNIVRNVKNLTDIRMDLPAQPNKEEMKKQFIEINNLLKYYDAIKIYNETVSNERSVTNDLLLNTHMKMNYNKSMKRTFEQYNKKGEIKFFRRSAISLTLGSIWAVYPLMKFSVNIIPSRLKNIIFDSSQSKSLFDEVIGIIAGAVLGPSYLAKNMITKGEMIKKYAKDIISPDSLKDTDPLMNEVISDMITGKIGKTREEPEEDFAVMIDEELEKMVQKDIESYERLRSNIPEKKELITTMIQQNEAIKKDPEKFNKEMEKNPSLKGSYVGMISNKVAKPKVSKKWKNRVHKLLCKLSLRSRDLSRLVSTYLTQSLAITYLSHKLTHIVMSQYIKDKALIGGNTIGDLCDYASPSFKPTIKKSYNIDKYHGQKDV